MGNPTFKAITHKVNMSLGILSVIIAVGISYSILAAAKGLTYSAYKFLENNIELEYAAAKKRCNALASTQFLTCIALAESNKKTSKLALETEPKTAAKHQAALEDSNVDFSWKTQLNNHNKMPVMSNTNPNAKKTLLI
ncbi:MAG: hypothetical protein WC733_08805 [Methylophilus sp.]|jgi:hypothetical protein